MKFNLVLAACAALLTLPVAAQATTYNLSDDFSDLINPNSPWSFTQGVTPLAHYTPSTANTLNPASGNGFWGVGSDYNVNTPTVIKVTQNGSGAAPYNDGDFLAGDVIMHSANPGTGDALYINWTAPTDGVISFSSSVWYAHSPVNRSNDINVFLDGNFLNGLTVTPAVTRSLALTSLSGSGLSVAAGDVLAFRVTATSGQISGSLTGLDATVDFTATATGVPEAATWAMMIMGFGGVGAAMRRRATRAFA